MFPYGAIVGDVSEDVVAGIWDTPFWHAVFEAEYQMVSGVASCTVGVVVCVVKISTAWVLPQHGRVAKRVEEGCGYLHGV